MSYVRQVIWLMNSIPYFHSQSAHRAGVWPRPTIGASLSQRPWGMAHLNKTVKSVYILLSCAKKSSVKRHFADTTGCCSQTSRRGRKYPHILYLYFFIHFLSCKNFMHTDITILHLCFLSTYKLRDKCTERGNVFFCSPISVCVASLVQS